MLKSFRIIRVWDDGAARETPLKPCQDRSEKGVALAKAEKENGGKKGGGRSGEECEALVKSVRVAVKSLSARASPPTVGRQEGDTTHPFGEAKIRQGEGIGGAHWP